MRHSDTPAKSTRLPCRGCILSLPPGSVEAILYFGGWDNPLLLFEDREQPDQWSIDLLHLGTGVAYTPKAEMPSYYLTAKIGVRCDALLFWRKTWALR